MPDLTMLQTLSVMATLGLSCGQADGSSSIDKAVLRSQFMAARSSLEAVGVSYTITPIAGPGRLQRCRASWSQEGMRLEVMTPHADGEDQFTRIFDAATAKGIFFDGVGHASVGTGAAVIGLDDLFTDYWCFIGHFPNRVIGEGMPMLNDPVHLLSLAETEAFESVEECGDGQSCVVLEWRPTPASEPMIRGWYLPHRGFAQAKLRTYSPSGDLRSEWLVEAWAGSGGLECDLPLGGRFRTWAPDGSPESERTIAIDWAADGAPLVSLNEVVDLGLDLPAGTTVLDLNTGMTTVVAGDLDRAATLAIRAAENAGAVRPSTASISSKAFAASVLAAGVLAFLAGLGLTSGARRRSAQVAS